MEDHAPLMGPTIHGRTDFMYGLNKPAAHMSFPSQLIHIVNEINRCFFFLGGGFGLVFFVTETDKLILNFIWDLQ
jgi:hypothetical protein